jgi:hypothetical protein
MSAVYRVPHLLDVGLVGWSIRQIPNASDRPGSEMAFSRLRPAPWILLCLLLHILSNIYIELPLDPIPILS